MLLAPYDEDGEWFADGSRWDYWDVGGRWTGALDGYRPEDDPSNIVECSMCHGTGVRPGGLEEFGQEWFDKCNGCNYCNGEGKCLAWHFQPHDGDILPVRGICTDFVPTACVTPDGEWHEGARVGWFGCESERHCSEEEWVRQYGGLLLAHRIAVAVLVDCHV